MISFKYRFYPTQQQIDFFNKSIGCSRFVWNNAVERNIASYKETGKFVFYHQLAGELVDMKHEHPWLKEVNSQSLQKTLRSFEVTLKRSFSKKAKGGFPKFKSKRNSSQSFVVPQHFVINGDTVKIPKLDTTIKFKKHRELVGVAKSLSIVRDIDRWFVVFNCETAKPHKKPPVNVVGLDLGLKTFACTSDGELIEYKQPVKLQQLIVGAQKALARKQKGSNNRHNARIKLAKLHRKQAAKRKDFHYKTANSIAKSNDVVVMEDLNIKGMVKNRKLSKAISSQGWAQFKQILTNKLEQTGGQIVEISRYFPSSKMCSCCGWINSDLKLSDRKWVCDGCDTSHDRDFNAAVNILNEGMRILTVRQELPDSKPVEILTSDSAIPNQVKSAKQEALVALATG